MEKNLPLRESPDKLQPECIRIITVRIDYTTQSDLGVKNLRTPEVAYISQYALGRDYHKVLRKKLQKLGQLINEHTPHQYRAFTDSAPILERAYAQKSGQGWIGKNTMLINKKSGSYFFLGELLTNIPLRIDSEYTDNHCGSCSACINICPTQAIIAPYQLDARRCISYLTIEYKGSIPIEFRKAIGNRIVGCDDCQLICPWNKFSKITQEKDFFPRDDFLNTDLLTLFSWDETTFLKKTEGSAIRRLGHVSWIRNIAIALGNAPKNSKAIEALKKKSNSDNPIIKEHCLWALSELTKQH
jgi:epoxyqueuosine reductase